MKALHIMIGKEKFTDGVVDLYNENFNPDEHEICYLMKDGQSTCIRSNISIQQHELITGNIIVNKVKFCKDMIILMKQFDFIVMHSFCLDGLSTLYLFFNKRFCRKHMIWVEWGADLFDFKLKEKANFLDKAIFFIKKSVRANVNSVICIFPPDQDYFRQEFPKSKAKVFYAPYMSSRSNQRKYEYHQSISRLKETKEKDEPIYIQIGHNAQKQLNHLKALEVLSKFKNENIMLVLPLSYCAEPDYVDDIVQYLENTFSGKYIVLKDFVPKEEYFKIIRRIDIAIFYTYRQTALSNIYEMINNNVKLFMPEGAVMKEYFCSLGIPINSIELIKNMDFQKFTSTIEWEKISGPKEFIDGLNDYNARLQHWINVYNELRKSNEQ